MAFLCDDVDVVLVQLTLQYFAQEELFELETIFAFSSSENLHACDWFSWTSGVIFADVAIGSASD